MNKIKLVTDEQLRDVSGGNDDCSPASDHVDVTALLQEHLVVEDARKDFIIAQQGAHNKDGQVCS